MSDWVWPATAMGILFGLLLYFRGDRLAGRLTRIPPVSWIHTWLFYRMYFDELYGSLFVAPVLGLAAGVAWVDRNVVDAAFNLGGQERPDPSPARDESAESTDKRSTSGPAFPPVDTTSR